MTIHKKLVVDDRGNPLEVIIPWSEYEEIAELLGLDLDPAAIGDLRQARRDRESGDPEAYLPLESL